MIKNKIENTMEKRTDKQVFWTTERDGCEVALSVWLVPQKKIKDREIFD